MFVAQQRRGLHVSGFMRQIQKLHKVGDGLSVVNLEKLKSGKIVSG